MEVGVAIAMLADDACKNASVFSWPSGSLQYQAAADGLEMEEDFRHAWKMQDFRGLKAVRTWRPSEEG